MIRFWEKVDVRGEDDCWKWVASTNVGGYGQFRGWIAHRFAYELVVGKIPDGKILMHLCDNRLCVNPKHLRVGTDQDNIDDMYTKGRDYHSHGEDHYKAVLTEDQVLAIYSDSRTQQVIADEYGVTRANISRIKCGRTWKHLTKG